MTLAAALAGCTGPLGGGDGTRFPDADPPGWTDWVPAPAALDASPVRGSYSDLGRVRTVESTYDTRVAVARRPSLPFAVAGPEAVRWALVLETAPRTTVVGLDYDRAAAATGLTQEGGYTEVDDADDVRRFRRESAGYVALGASWAAVVEGFLDGYPAPLQAVVGTATGDTTAARDAVPSFAAAASRVPAEPLSTRVSVRSAPAPEEADGALQGQVAAVRSTAIQESEEEARVAIVAVLGPSATPPDEATVRDWARPTLEASGFGAETPTVDVDGAVVRVGARRPAAAWLSATAP